MKFEDMSFSEIEERFTIRCISECEQVLDLYHETKK